uniref:3-dehydroquinate dehydratase n=1 Tax=uncultured marine bacterium 578 TaxID=257399 RepID=Q6SFT4_9BACT|nr:3-dehydroquinate dehydratase, type II, putative [uncultured marine bacterium 578]
MNNRLLIINGPGLSDLSNYNETGYDDLTLDAVQQKCSETCEGLGLEMDFRQNDNESELLSVLIEDIDNFDALIINPAGHSQASSIDLDMYSTVINKITNQGKQVVEVRIENIFKQGKNKPLQGPESGVGFVGGLGMHSYVLAIKAINKKISNN